MSAYCCSRRLVRKIASKVVVREALRSYGAIHMFSAPALELGRRLAVFVLSYPAGLCYGTILLTEMGSDQVPL